ncbi:MAG: methyltransferase domain-containing protein [Nannocystaceae bacterium]|nr:methyltransferase domain-containing protein [Nannocystaceae bacterium]
MSDPIEFDQQCAASYDQRFAKLAPITQALHLVMRVALDNLPSNARILCVGAGTGAEILSLAKAHPGWRFTAVDPAVPMLELCRRRLDAAGFLARCEFHEGYLDSLNTEAPFDAATAILVSHFLLDTGDRTNFFHEIARRLRPKAPLVSADLSAETSTLAAGDALTLWRRALLWAELPPEEVDDMLKAFGKGVAVLPPREIESILIAAGFESPVHCYQAFMMHGWCSRRSDS